MTHVSETDLAYVSQNHHEGKIVVAHILTKIIPASKDSVDIWKDAPVWFAAES